MITDDDQGYMHAALKAKLLVTQGCVVSVVGKEEDNGVIHLSIRLQLSQYLADSYIGSTGVVVMHRPGFAQCRRIRKIGRHLNSAVVEELVLEAPKTKELVAAMDRFDIISAVVVVDEISVELERESNNLGWVKVVTPDRINTYDILAFDSLIMTRKALEVLEGAMSI